MSDDKPLHEQAYIDYMAGMKYADIAEKHGVSLSAVKSWAQRYWKKDAKNKPKLQPQPKHKKDATAKGKSQTDSDVHEAEKQVKKAVMRNEQLTDKQRLFCLYWLKNKNATIAAIKAGYSPDSAHVQGSELLKNPKVREYIELFISEVKNNVMINELEIVERYMKIAFSDITDFADFFQENVPVIIGGKVVMTKDAVTGEPLPILKTVNTVRLRDATMVDGSLISEVSQGKDGVKIKLEDRQKALEWLAKYFLMNPTDKHKIELENCKLDISILKTEAELKLKEEEEPPDNNFLEALGAVTADVWGDESDD